MNNRPFSSQLKIIKLDAESGKKVTLNGASFKIKDSKGNYVVQKVGGKKYDTFTTNSKNVVTVKDAEEGTVIYPKIYRLLTFLLTAETLIFTGDFDVFTSCQQRYLKNFRDVFGR